MATVFEASVGAMRYMTKAERCPPTPQKILPVVTEHISPGREKVKNAWSLDFIVLCAFFTIFRHWWLWSSF